MCRSVCPVAASAALGTQKLGNSFARIHHAAQTDAEFCSLFRKGSSLDAGKGKSFRVATEQFHAGLRSVRRGAACRKDA
jgi:hypothetical protein